MVCPQKLDEHNKRVKSDGIDAKALCLRLDRFLEGNRAALALVRVPSEEEEQARALHRQREQLVKVRKVLEAQGRSLVVNHGIEPVQGWWKRRAFAALRVPDWIRVLLQNTQPIVLSLQSQIDKLTLQLQEAATAEPPRGLGKMTSVIIDREIGNWHRFNNQWAKKAAALCDQAWQPAAARCLGGTGLENGPLPAQLPRGTQMERSAAKRSAHHRAQAIVAVARQLAIDLWRVRTGRLTPEQLGLEI